jgi:amino acid transporter
VTAELGSAYPEPAGGVVWVEKAFGKKAGAIAGYMTWVAGVTDNAIYPALFLDYVHSMLGVSTEGLTRYLIVAAISLVLSTVNYLGLEIVGNMLILVSIVSMSPFILLSVLGSVKIDPSRWMQMPDPSQLPPEEVGRHAAGLLQFPNFGGVIWRPFLNNLFWNLNSFDSAANFAGEVHEPGRVFPKAMFISVLMVICCYFIPLLVATGTTASAQADWTEGHLAAISSEVVGTWLGGWTVLASAVSNIALYEAEMSSDAFQLAGLAERGMVPKCLARRSRFSTPTYGIIIGTIIVLLFNTADFTSIVEMLNFTYSISLLMEFAAFVKLRYTHDHGKTSIMTAVPFQFSLFFSFRLSVFLFVLQYTDLTKYP